MFSDLGTTSGQSHNDGFRDEPPPRMACALCRRRKLRCNRQLPCDSCTRLGFDCVYEAAKSQHGPKKHRVQKPDSPSARSSLGATQGSTADSRHRPVARKASNQSLTNTEWSADQLRPEDMAELEQLYFKTLHESIPILHHFRYNTATVSEPRLRPPNYLRYIICALGASISQNHSTMHNALYRAARKTLEDTELNDHSTESIPLARPQAWILIAIYELLQMHFHRWWMSTARAVRLTQMMGLHLLDGLRPTKRMMHPAKDWTELEEQRRAFWMAFALDRYAAFGYGCPMIIDDKDVHTLLPVTDEAFQDCAEMKSITLHQALNDKTIENLPPMAAGIVLTAEVGHKLKLLQQDDIANRGRQAADNFWRKINWLDDTLHYAFSVPPHLAASGYNHTPILTYLHMCAPCSTILLHQAAEEQASAHGITPSSLLESQALRLAAAEMVASTMRLASHIDVRLLHPFTGHCLYTAARVLMRSLTVRTEEGQQRSLMILLEAMGQLQSVNPLAGGYFKDLDADFPGMRKSLYAQMQANSTHHLSGSDTASTTSSYTPTPPLPAGLPFINGFVVDNPPPANLLVCDIGAGTIPAPYHGADDNSSMIEPRSGAGSGGQGQHDLYYSSQEFYTP